MTGLLVSAVGEGDLRTAAPSREDTCRPRDESLLFGVSLPGDTGAGVSLLSERWRCRCLSAIAKLASQEAAGARRASPLSAGLRQRVSRPLRQAASFSPKLSTIHLRHSLWLVGFPSHAGQPREPPGPAPRNRRAREFM